MAFSGDLENLSIVDVIQLLHTTRQTGTLTMAGRKGEILVAFKDGYIVGARHYDHDVRIGAILTESGVISPETLQKGLAMQDLAGVNHKPLVATLLENDLADRNTAYRCLETLIELAIVEILTWKKGTFTLQVDEIIVCDEFRYFPEDLHKDFILPTEHVLMDALRIFDEKMRDGLLLMEEDTSDISPEPSNQSACSVLLSADDLGLGDLDTIKRKLPGFHEALRDEKADGLQPALRCHDVFKGATTRIQKATSLPETALILLETVATLFPRALTLVVWEKELVAERSVGITTPAEEGVGPVLGFKFSHTSSPLLNSVMGKGLLFYGASEDHILKDHLYPAIGAPTDPTLLLLPLKLGKRVVALVYADFGTRQVQDIPLAKLESCAEHASMAIESALLRKQLATKTD